MKIIIFWKLLVYKLDLPVPARDESPKNKMIKCEIQSKNE